MTEAKTHHFDLTAAAQAERKQYPDGVPVATVAPLWEGVNNPDILPEERLWANYTGDHHYASAYLLPSSPHFERPHAKIKEVVDAIIKATGSLHSFYFPEILYRSRAKIPLHFQAWLYEKEGPRRPYPNSHLVHTDFNDMRGEELRRSKAFRPEEEYRPLTYASLIQKPPVDRTDIFRIANRGITNLIKTIKIFRPDSRPVVCSGFGHASPKKRGEEGRGRGLPSLEPVHIQIMTLEPTKQKVDLVQDLNPRALMKHLAPWERLIFERFGDQISQVLERITLDTLARTSGVNVHTIDETEAHKNGAVTVRRLHEVEFSDSISFADAMNVITEVISQLNDTFQDTNQLYEEFHLTDEPDVIRESISRRLVNVGFSKEAAAEFTAFILKIRPTYGQLMKWEEKLTAQDQVQSPKALAAITALKRKYERVREKLAKKPGRASLLLEDTLKEPQDPTISTTLSALLTGYWAITDYELNKYREAIGSVKKIVFRFGAGSQRTFSEDFLGSAIFRPQRTAR